MNYDELVKELNRVNLEPETWDVSWASSKKLMLTKVDNDGNKLVELNLLRNQIKDVDKLNPKEINALSDYFHTTKADQMDQTVNVPLKKSEFEVLLTELPENDKTTDLRNKIKRAITYSDIKLNNEKFWNEQKSILQRWMQ